MSKYKKYMTDRKIEKNLSDKERQNRIFGFNQMIGLNEMDGYIFSEEEKEFVLYCILNDVPTKEMLRISLDEHEEGSSLDLDLEPRYIRAD